MSKKHNLHKVVEELLDVLKVNDPLVRREHRAEFTAILKKHRAFEYRCNECGRRLHHPESLKMGLGPVCSGLGNKLYVRR